MEKSLLKQNDIKELRSVVSSLLSTQLKKKKEKKYFIIIFLYSNCPDLTFSIFFIKYLNIYIRQWSITVCHFVDEKSAFNMKAKIEIQCSF